METQNYDALETNFNSFDISKLRGLVSENSAFCYAAYVLYISYHKIRYGVIGLSARLCWYREGPVFRRGKKSTGIRCVLSF